MGFVGLGLREKVISLTRCQTNSCWDPDGPKTAPDGLFFPQNLHNRAIVPGRGYYYVFGIFIHCSSRGRGNR